MADKNQTKDTVAAVLEQTRRAALTPLQLAIEDQLASEHPEVPVPFIAYASKADGSYVDAAVLVNGKVVRTYPVALVQGRWYFNVNMSFGPLLKAITLLAYNAGRPEAEGQITAELLQLTANSLSVPAPTLKGRAKRKVDLNSAKAM